MLSLTLGSSGDDLGDALDAAEAFCDQEGVPPRVAARLGVILDELLSNVVNYAFDGRTDGVVELRLVRRGEEIEGEIVDDGKPFVADGVAVPDTTLSVEDRPVGGLGLHLVRSLTTRLDLWREADRNHVRFAVTTTAPDAT